MPGRWDAKMLALLTAGGAHPAHRASSWDAFCWAATCRWDQIECRMSPQQPSLERQRQCSSAVALQARPANLRFAPRPTVKYAGFSPI